MTYTTMPVYIPNGVEVTVDMTRSSPQQFSRLCVTCFRCSGIGHLKHECFTYKTRLCSLYKAGRCSESEKCCFAHGESELRYPWMTRCVRVVKKNGTVERLGCGEYGHTYKACPLHKKNGKEG